MNCRISIFSVVVVAAAMVVTSVVSAECPVGLTKITFIQGGTGAYMYICVNPDGIGQIGGESDVVIPAACPCDMSVLRQVPWSSLYYVSCLAMENEIIDEVVVRALTSDGQYVSVYAIAPWSYPAENQCLSDLLPAPPFYSSEQQVGLTASEVEACAALVWAFAVYELGLDCLGEFPDFEPPPMP